MSVLYQGIACACGASNWVEVSSTPPISLHYCASCFRVGLAAHTWDEGVFLVPTSPNPFIGPLMIDLYYRKVLRPIWMLGDPVYHQWFKEVCEVDKRLMKYCLGCLKLESDEHLSNKDYRRLAHSVKRAQRFSMFSYPARPEEVSSPLPFLPDDLIGYRLNKKWGSDNLWDLVDHETAGQAKVPDWMVPLLERTGFQPEVLKCA